jgi:hypothetical protein
MTYLVCGLAWLVLLLSALPGVAYDGPVDNQLFVTGHKGVLEDGLRIRNAQWPSIRKFLNQ